MKNEIILEFIRNKPLTSSKDIHLGLQESFSYATIKRILKKLSGDGLIIIKGKGRSTKYALSSPSDLFYPLDIDEYFKNEQDQRKNKRCI